MATFAFDPAAKQLVATAKRVPTSYAVDRRKNTYTGHAGSRSQMHRAGIVAEIYAAFLQGRGRLTNVQNSRRICTGLPAFKESVPFFFIFGPAENDSKHPPILY